jgi:hypothetical protein
VKASLRISVLSCRPALAHAMQAYTSLRCAHRNHCRLVARLVVLVGLGT